MTSQTKRLLRSPNPLDATGAPVRSASVFVATDSEDVMMQEMPMFSGRTDAQGRLVVDDMAQLPVMILARHPAYGAVTDRIGSG